MKWDNTTQARQRPPTDSSAEIHGRTDVKDWRGSLVNCLRDQQHQHRRTVLICRQLAVSLQIIDKNMSTQRNDTICGLRSSLQLWVEFESRFAFRCVGYEERWSHDTPLPAYYIAQKPLCIILQIFHPSMFISQKSQSRNMEHTLVQSKSEWCNKTQ